MAPMPEFKPRTFSTMWLSFFGQWLAFIIVAVLIVPTVVVISQLFSGRTVIGIIGLVFNPRLLQLGLLDGPSKINRLIQKVTWFSAK